MEKLISRKEAANLLGISLATLDAARMEGLISYVQYVDKGCAYFIIDEFFCLDRKGSIPYCVPGG